MVGPGERQEIAITYFCLFTERSCCLMLKYKSRMFYYALSSFILAGYVHFGDNRCTQ